VVILGDRGPAVGYIAVGIAMGLGLASMWLTSRWSDERLLLVGATSAIGLRDKDGFEALSPQEATALLGSLAAHSLSAVRGFLVQLGHPRLPLDCLEDSELLDWLRMAIRTRNLVVLRAGDGEAGGESSETQKLRRLVRKIESLSRGRLSYSGRRYRLVVDVDLGRLSERDRYEVVAHNDATRILDGIAKQSGGAAEELPRLLAEASRKLTGDWRPPFQPDGLVLLRRIAVQDSIQPEPGDTITPSQMKKLVVKPEWIEIEVLDQDGEPYQGRYRVELPDGISAEGNFDEQGLYGNYELDPGNCKLTLLDRNTLKGAGEEEPQSHLAVHVQDSDGKPVEGVPIILNDEQSMGSTDSEGNLDLGLHPPGTYAVATQTETHANASQELDAVGGADTMFQLELKAKTPTITAKQESYIVVLDSSGNEFAGYPILEFDITDGTPGCFLDVQVQREDAGNLTGGLGLAGAWDKSKPASERAGQDTFSSWSDGETGLQLDGSGKATYRMPLEWWRDLARQPLSDFTTQTIHFKAATAPSESSSVTVDSPVATASVQNNLVDMQVVDNGYINGGLNKSVSMEFTVLEANTTEMYTIVQWRMGSNPTWGGPRAYGIVMDYNLNHDFNGPDWSIDRLGTNPRYHDGLFAVSGGGKKATTTDAPGGPIGPADTHDFFALDFDTRVHLNFEVPAAVTITKKEGSAPIWGIVVGELADPQPVTLANATWDTRILQVRTVLGVTVTHPDAYGGP
jgi:hypothetical protein